jgi:penicillin amidase
MTETISHTVAGLENPAEINVDRWGICHIRAATRRDAFFVQGFNAARDRLWQLDTWRKRGLGRMAADFGPGFLAQDRAARLFLYRGDMDAEWAAYGTPEAHAVTEAFVQGINAWIALAEADPALLPPEFAAMGTRPERWDTADVVRIRSHGLVRNVLSEAARARVLAATDLETDLARRSIEPPHTIVIPEGFDPACVPADVLDVFRLATAAPDFSPERLAAPLDEAWRWTKVTDQGDVYLQGSNNWAVAATHTDTGRAILASDPHRAHALPSLRSVVHLTAPGLDVIGAGEPALPGVSIGHNGHAAFSLTIFPMDQEDLHVYETQGNTYRYGDGFEAMTIVTETIAVRGCADQQVTLKFTRHGPVVCETGTNAFAVRSVWSEPGASAYFAALAYIGATSVESFAEALSHWSTPSVSQLYADVSGRVAWFAAGKSPVRPNWDGLLPVPGDGRYEWNGFYPFSALPQTIDPASGFVATANEMNLPAGFPSEEVKLGFEWSEHSRSKRIHDVLGGQPSHSLAQSMALQTDDTSIPARRLTKLLDGFNSPGATLLTGWNHRLEITSPAAALHEVWWSKHLKPALLDLLVPDPIARPLMVPGDLETLVGILEDGDRRVPDVRSLLATTLDAAYAECAVCIGKDAKAWQWGSLHHGAFPHPLGRVADLPGVDRLPKGGSGSTVMNAGYRLSDFKVTHGASFRMVVDVGNWDESRFINAPGQSGDPRSPHYADLAPLWAAGTYVPMLYSVAAVDAATTLKILLSP